MGLHSQVSVLLTAPTQHEQKGVFVLYQSFPIKTLHTFPELQMATPQGTMVQMFRFHLPTPLHKLSTYFVILVITCKFLVSVVPGNSATTGLCVLFP